jgi:uncharacterized protein (TIGR02145 family)
MRRIFLIILFTILCANIIVAQTIDTCGCTVNSSLPVGKLTFLCYNLGANPNMTIQQQMDYAPTDIYDATVYGDLYQWGRNTDGHEKRNSPTTESRSLTDIPGHGMFVNTPIAPLDWRSTANPNLWGFPKKPNDPCPGGWRMPTTAEWASIYGISSGNTWTWHSTGTAGWKISAVGNAAVLMFLPAAGSRKSGIETNVVDENRYWSSTSSTVLQGGRGAIEVFFYPDGTYFAINATTNTRSQGAACRCIKDDDYCTIDTVINRTICGGKTYDFNGRIITASGTYKDTIAGVVCDTVVTLNLTVTPLNEKIINANICASDSYNFNGRIITEAGTYKDSIAGVECDTVVTLNLTVTPLNEKIINATICENKSYDFYGKILNATGTYFDTITTSVGCDSLIVLLLTVNQTATTNLTDAIEQSEAYNKNGFNLPAQNVAGVFAFTQNLTTTLGCDSTVTISLTVTNTQKIEVFPIDELCGDDAYFLIEYNAFDVEKISALFDTKASAAGFLNISPQNFHGQPISVVLPKNVRPDNYSLTLVFEGNGLAKEIPVNFVVLYPSRIIKQKWNDVLALQNDRYNGGYSFSAYEWYRNGVKIAGENGSYYYSAPAYLDFTAQYRARITRADDGVTLFTCPIIPVPHTDSNPYPTFVTANQYFTINTPAAGRILIFSITGTPISQQNIVQGANQVLAPSSQGAYIMVISSNAAVDERQILMVR